MLSQPAARAELTPTLFGGMPVQISWALATAVGSRYWHYCRALSQHDSIRGFKETELSRFKDRKWIVE
jgi:hypothetical protein